MRKWALGAVAASAVVLCAGTGPAWAGGGEEIKMSGSPGPGKTVTLSGGEEDECFTFGGGGDGGFGVIGAPVKIDLIEDAGDLIASKTIEASDTDGSWSTGFAIPRNHPDTGDPLVVGDTYEFKARCNRPEIVGEITIGPFDYEDLEFTMGAAAPGATPDPEPAPDPEPEPAPAPTTPPTVQGNTVTQPPPPAAAPAAPVEAPRALAFTGDGTERLAATGAAVLAIGLAVVGLGRRVRPRPVPPA